MDFSSEPYEKERLETLHGYNVLDTLPEKSFDDLVLLAAQICESPIALITFVDKDRQWFKAKIGLEATETPREFAFCSHTIKEKEIFVISDATKDDRFATNPLVTSKPHIRFYAGAPLLTSKGVALGSLCVIDRKERTLRPEQIAALQALSRQAVDQLELRRKVSDLIAMGVTQKKTEDRLVEIQNRFYAFMNHSSALAWMKNDKGQMVYINKTFERVFNKTAADVLGKDDFQLWPQEFAKDIRADDLLVLSSHKAMEQVQLLPTPDGQMHYWLSLKFPFEDAHQNSFVGGMSVDITERKNTESQLAEAKSKLQGVLDSSTHVSIIATDQNGVITVFNAGAEAMLGYSASEMVHKQTPAIFHLSSEEEARAQEIKQVDGKNLQGFDVFVDDARQKGHDEHEWTFVRKDKTTLRVSLTVTALKNAEGKAIGFLGIAKDITVKRKAAEDLALAYQNLEKRVGDRTAELNKAVSRFQELADAMPQIVWTATPEGVFDYYNEQWYEFIGVSQGKRDLRWDNAVLHPDDLEKCRAGWRTAVQTGTAYDLEYRFKDRKTGNFRWFLGRAVPIKDDQGRVQRWIGTCTDIDLQKHTMEIERARDAAVEASRLKAEFLATMSHEIRTPMNAVLGMTTLLADSPLTDEQRGFTETLRSSGEALLSIINDILDFSKIESGKLTFEEIEFDLRIVVDGVSELLAEKASSKGLGLFTLWTPDVGSSLKGDPGRLRQVLLNLMNNAVKFTEKGDVTLRIRQERDSETDVLIRFEVTDTGIGLSQESIARLFQPFTQADSSTTRKFGGTGLGLVISKRIVEQMGGTIEIQSALGKGTTFSFTAAFKKNIAALPALLPPFAGVRALILEDHQIGREALEQQMTAWKIPYQSVSTGNDALVVMHREATAGRPFAIAILDTEIPGFNGAELAATLTKDPLLSSTQVLYIIPFHYRSSGDASSLAASPFCLRKPFKQSQLLDVMTKALLGAAPLKINPENKASSTAPKPFKILLAEDNAANQQVATHFLKKLGYRCDMASTGEEAFQTIQRVPYDLILMDCHMPVMDGYQATGEIRKFEGTSKHTVIVAMTANALQGDREKCLQAGMDDYISKPIDASKLKSVLERWLKPKADGVLAETIVVDDQRLRVLSDGDEETLQALLEIYIDETTKDVKNLKDAVHIESLKEIERIAHGSAGASLNYGMVAMAPLFRSLELMAKEHRFEKMAATQLVTQIENEFYRTQQQLRQRHDPSIANPTTVPNNPSSKAA